MGMKLVVLGAILLANQIYFKYDWWLLFGSLLVLKGFCVMIMKGCPCHKKEEKKKNK